VRVVFGEGKGNLGTGTAPCCTDANCDLCNDDLILSVYDLKTNSSFVIEEINKWLGRNSGVFRVSKE